MCAKALTVALLAISTVCLPSPAQIPDAEERRALVALAEALRIGELAGERVWPGFDVTVIPIALYRREGSVLLVQHPGPPAGFELLDTELLGIPVYRGSHSPVFAANTATRFSGAVTACIDRAHLDGGELRAEDVGLILHEATHAFQGRAPDGGPGRWPQENAALVADYPTDDPVNNAWIQIESELLIEALQAADPVPFLRDFLEVRRHRQALLAPELREFERHLECNEGLADYAAYRALALASLEGDAFSGYGQRLHRRLRDDRQTGRGGRRQRFYQSGAAQALLLDRLGVAGWKRRVEEGGTLQAVLAEAMAQRETGRTRRIETIAEERAFDERRDREALMARAMDAQRRVAMLDLLASEATKVVLDLSRCGGAGSVRLFDPMNLVVVDDDTRLHTRVLELGFDDGAVRLERPVIQDLDNERLVWTVAPETTFESGGRTLAEGADVHGDLRIHGRGVEMESAAARLVWQGDVVWIAAGAGPDVEAPMAEIRAELRRASAARARPLPAPPFAVRDLQGAEHRHPDPAFERTALVFFSAAAWARPSHAFVREICAAGDGPGAGRRLLIVGSQCALDELLTFAEDLPDWAVVVHDDRRELAGLFGARRYPTSLWIDAQGHVVGRDMGNDADHRRAFLERLRN